MIGSGAYRAQTSRGDAHERVRHRGSGAFHDRFGGNCQRTGDTITTRIASNIVQGIGFLGAGVILRERGSVVGLTTAAAIFAEAAIGMAAGGGLYAVSGARRF